MVQGHQGEVSKALSQKQNTNKRAVGMVQGRSAPPKNILKNFIQKPGYGKGCDQQTLWSQMLGGAVDLFFVAVFPECTEM
jgi:hypothetical protein